MLSFCILTCRLNGQVSCTPVFIDEYQSSGAGSAVQPHAIKAMSDGTVLVAGRAALPGAATYDGFVSKHNADGTTVWSFFFGGSGNDDFTGITPLNDGTTLLYGTTGSFGHPEGKGWLVHIDATGTVLSSFLIGASAGSTDRLKTVQQYADGDLVGSFNVNDSSAASDPVLFKMGLDGTLRWTHRFDDGDDDSFTTLAISGDTLYAGGYYKAGGLSHGVITEIKAEDGSYLLSQNINDNGLSYNEQITGLEIYNNTISYGLYITGGTPYVNGIYLIQTDLAGNTKHAAVAGDPQGGALLTIIRTQDSGFYVLRSDNSGIGAPAVNKINTDGYFEWGIYLAGNDNYSTFSAFTMTPDGGCIAAGHYSTYLASYSEIMRLVKMTAKGEVGTCNLFSETFTGNPATYYQAAFHWAGQPALTPLALSLTVTAASDPLSPFSSCASSVCVDHTPIPKGCGKTYNIQYTSSMSSLLRDVIPTPDGGKVSVGELEVAPGTDGVATFNGMVMQYQSNGEIAWSKSFHLPDYNLQFRRILRCADGNILALGDGYPKFGNYDNWQMFELKLDNSGNLLWSKNVTMDMTEMVDAVATPDNGFVVAFDDSYPWLGRFNAEGELLWQREVSHAGFGPVYKAIACSQDAIFVGYDGSDDQFGIDRLDLATGSLTYSHRYSGGSGTQVQVNNIFTNQDSIYAFLYHYVPGATAPVTNLMFALDKNGQSYRALNLGNDPLNPNPTFSYSDLDGTPPSVTITPDLDFWLASRITLSGVNYLDVTRFKADGTVEFSKLHTAINGYLPYNVRPQGKGVIVVGGMPAVHTGNPNFSNAFVLKLDSSGQLQSGAAANCLATDRPFPVTSCTTCSMISTQQETSWDPGNAGVGDYVPAIANTDVTPVLFCFQPANCNSVNLKQKGAVCSSGDTLVYYLDNSGNCGAAATWFYDPGFFRPAHISGDSIQLIVEKAGSTAVGAQVEGYCSVTSQTQPTSIVFTSLTGLGLAADTVICSNGPISLQATPGYASYLWSDNSTASNLQVAAPGTYSLAATDLCGHVHDATVQVADANAAFHVTPDTIKCNQDVDPLRATSGYSNYQWSPANNLQPQANMAFVSPDVNTTYTVTAQLSPGCTVTASTLVTVLSSPPIRFGNDTSICSGDSVLLDGGPGFTSYLWNTGATAAQIYVHDPGTYALTAACSNGCASRDTFELAGLYAPHPVLDANAVYCAGQDRMLNTGPSFASYLWNDGSTGASFIVADTGTYWVAVTDSHGCIGSDTVHVLTMAQPPKGFLPQDTTICQYGDLVLSTRESFNSYSWSDLSAGATLTVKQPGTYWVEVTDKNGCTATDTVSITQKYCLVGLFVPNAFTPDGNGSNDRLRPLIYGQVELLDFAVFDRFGQRVFETRQASQGWDGSLSGSPAPAGTYVWFCRYRYPGEPAKMEKGTVILLR